MNSRHIKSFKWKYFWKGTNAGPIYKEEESNNTIRRVLDHIKAVPSQRRLRSYRAEIESCLYHEK